MRLNAQMSTIYNNFDLFSFTQPLNKSCSTMFVTLLSQNERHSFFDPVRNPRTFCPLLLYILFALQIYATNSHRLLLWTMQQNINNDKAQMLISSLLRQAEQLSKNLDTTCSCTACVRRAKNSGWHDRIMSLLLMTFNNQATTETPAQYAQVIWSLVFKLEQCTNQLLTQGYGRLSYSKKLEQLRHV